MMIPKKPDNVIWTQEQWNAIYDTGCNILVSAGAGSGKTAVLTERLTQKVLNGVSLNELIVLTFTKDAASSMKERLRESLKKVYSETKNSFVLEQLELIDVSHIQTFDSFTSDIVKTYNYLLDVDKNFIVFDNQYHEIIKKELTEKVINNLFEINDPNIMLLADTYTLKNSKLLVNSIVKVLNKIDLIIDYNDSYFEKYYEENHINYVMNIYDNVIKSKVNLIFELLEKAEYFTDDAILNDVYALEKIYEPLRNIELLDYEDIYNVFPSRLPSRKRALDDNEAAEYKKVKEKIKKLSDSIKELVIKPKEKLVDEYLLTKKYSQAYFYVINLVLKELNKYKKEHHMYTFNDISKLVIKLLKENPNITSDLKYKTKEILVDEYQDTSDIQEALIHLIANNNLFLVGDIKQSIYRFRNANPLIFANKLEKYRNGLGGKVIDLTYNFRSREEVIKDINNIFIPLMEKDYGGVDYTLNQQLTFGNTAYNKLPKPNEYNLEHLIYEIEPYKDFSKMEIEAFIIGFDILEKMKTYQIFDKETKGYRKPKYKDFSIILSSKKVFKEFENIFKYLGIPLITTETSSFIRSEEIVFIKSILECAYSKCYPNYEKIKFNKSLLSILRSFVIEEKDDIIHKFYGNEEINLRAFNKELDSLLIKYSQMIENASLSSIISEIYKDFNLYHKIIKVGNVIEREKKLDFLYSKSFEFNTLGILEFIKYLEYIYSDDELDIEYKCPIDGVDGVTITTIHKSKGLEYPICYFGNLDREFNLKDTYGSFLFSNDYGLILEYENEGLNHTFLKTVFKKKYYEEEISEKIRLFYVALTRAKEKIILVSSTEYEHVPKQTINCLEDMLCYSEEYLLHYDKRISLLNNPLFRKDYTKINKRSLSKKEMVKEYSELNQEISHVNYDRASKKMLKLNTQDTANMLELGTKFHNVLENISIKNANLGYYDSYLEYNIVKKFINSDLIKNLKIINEYHEYAYFDETGHKSIIDLILETEDKLYLIDYKLSNTDDENYINQLNQYKNYLMTVSKKEIKVYLYSLFRSEFKEIA